MHDEKKPVSNKPVKLSKAPPPISPVRGRFVPKKNESDRKPRWNKWRLMPEVKEWEAVALSLNIEPEKIKTNPNAWMGAAHPFNEGDEFNDRLATLNKQSTNRTHFPTPCILNMADWYNCEVRLDEFAAWCIHVAFEIPPELSALAKATPQSAEIVEAVSSTKEKARQPEASVKLHTMQEDEILRIIREVLELNPLKLKKPRAGTAGIKADVRKTLSIPTPTFQSNRVFDKAWQRLRDNSQIGEE